MNDAAFRKTDDPFAVVGVARGATAAEIKRAYRKRARELHPDVCQNEFSAERFQELVRAYQKLVRLKPGSAEMHPAWEQLPEMYQYWAHELGHDTSEALDEWITALGLFDGDDPVVEMTGESAEEEDSRSVDIDGAFEIKAVGEYAQPDDDDTESRAGITAVLAYREYLGNQQWRVLWSGEPTEESWEVFRVLDTELLKREAKRVQAVARVAEA